MKTIITAIIKGGSGKTATSAALAQAAAKDGKRVLAVDLDPQANLTRTLGADPDEPGAFYIFTGEPANDLPQETDQGIDVISGSPDLATVKTRQGSAYMLKEALQPLKRKYDFCIIDTPPSMGELLFNGLFAADQLLIPMEADIFSLQGLQQICELTRQLRDQGAKVKPVGCILTRFDGRSKINKRIKELAEEAGNTLQAPLLGCIRGGIAVREAMALGESLFEYAPKSKPAQDYSAIYEALKV